MLRLKVDELRTDRTVSFQFPILNNLLGITNCANNPNGGSVFKLSDLPSYTEFTALFDQYRIMGVSIKWLAGFSESGMFTGPTAQLPNLLTVLDHDDGAILTTRDDYLQYKTFKEERLDKVLTMEVVPRVATAVYNGAFTGYAQVNDRPWLDTSSAGIEHYGIKWGISFPVTAATSVSVGYLTVDFTFHLEFRTTR